MSTIITRHVADPEVGPNDVIIDRAPTPGHIRIRSMVYRCLIITTAPMADAYNEHTRARLAAWPGFADSLLDWCGR